jgi:hypothetical protein
MMRGANGQEILSHFSFEGFDKNGIGGSRGLPSVAIYSPQSHKNKKLRLGEMSRFATLGEAEI